MTDQAQQTSQKIDAEIAKLLAETAKINAETRFYPFIIGAGAIGALATVATAISSVARILSP